MRIRGFQSSVERPSRELRPRRLQRARALRLKPDTGATLIEILVVISVMAIMFAIGLPAISTQIANAELHQGTREVVSVLRRVRAAAINQQAPHYVKLESNQLQVYRCVPNSDFTDCTWTAFENPVVLPNSVTINFSASDFPELPDTPAGGSIQNVPQGAVYFSPRGGYPSTGTPGEEYEINIDSVRNSTSRTVTVVRETGHIEIESP